MDLSNPKQFTLATSPPTGEPEKRPEMGEQTGGQSQGGVYGSFPFYTGQSISVRTSTGSTILRTLAGGWDSLPGYPEAPPGTYETYRWMDEDPTLALAKAITFAPILAAGVQYKSKKGVPDERVEFIKSIYDPQLAFLLNQKARAVTMGWRGFEKVFYLKDGKIVKKFKPLRWEKTDIMTDKKTGKLAGLRQGNLELPIEKIYVYTYDMEDDDYYGRSRYENVRRNAWWKSMQTGLSSDKLAQKTSGIQPIVKGPLGESMVDENGTAISGSTAALRLIAGLAAGRGVYMENLVTAIDQIQQYPEMAKASKWDIDFFDAGSTSSASGSFLEWLKYYDSQKFRGFFKPERMALEGSHGTLAEADAHGDIGKTDSELLGQDMFRCLNWHSVDQDLALNYGEQARGDVWLEMNPLSDPEKAFFREIFKQLLVNQSLADQAYEQIDWDAVADRAKMPKSVPVLEINTLDKALPEPSPNGNGKLNPEQDKQVGDRFAEMNKDRDS